MGVCLAEDDFARSGYLTDARWIANLSDGTTCYQDDGRPGEAEPSAWARLREHCRDKGVWVVGLSIQFRSNVVAAAPSGAFSYFFRKNVVGWLNGRTDHNYLTGHQDAPGGPVTVVRWATPALVPRDVETRDPADPLGVGDSLISRLS